MRLKYKKEIHYVKMATTTKDMWVANLVELWRGDSNSISVIDFYVVHQYVVKNITKYICDLPVQLHCG